MRVVLGMACILAAGVIASAPLMAQTLPATLPDPTTSITPSEASFGGRVARRAAELAARGDDRDDLAALQAWYAANPDKPLWIEQATYSLRARAAIAELALADDWGLSAATFKLPPAPLSSAPHALADAEARLTLAILTYARHARGGRAEPTRLSESLDRTANVLDPAKVIEGIAAASQTDAYLRKLHPQHPQFERLRQLYLALRSGKSEAQPAPVAEEPQPEQTGRKRKSKSARKPSPAPAITPERVLVNMEQWRWMPETLGTLHAVVNIPEFSIRVVKDDAVIHSERVVVGTPANQTPIFSKEMATVVFQPGWGVPAGIKVKELLPRLLAGGDPITGRGLTLKYRGREVSPSSIDWRSVDIRKVDVIQPPGPGNALGMVKFLFPNKHDVYLHDTPSKSLFNADARAFSHGCVRVRNPLRLAEIVFAETGGWSQSRVASLVRSKPDNQVPVPGNLNVHLTYFTVTVDDDGKANSFRDIYGHESRIRAGLDGRYDKIVRNKENLNDLRSRLVSRARPARGAFDQAGRIRSRTVAGNRTPRTTGYSGGGFFSFLGGF